MRGRTGSWVLVVFGVLLPGSASALDLWVDRDSHGGQCANGRAREDVTLEEPWCTLAVAAAQVQPGDVVHVRQGLYTEIQSCPACEGDAVLQVTTSGTEDAPIRFVADPEEQVRITGASGALTGVRISPTVDEGVAPRFIEVSGFTITGFAGTAVRIVDTSDITLRSLDVAGCTSGAVELERTARVTLEFSQVHENTLGATSAIALSECGEGNVVRANLVWTNTDDSDPADVSGHAVAMTDCGATGAAVIEDNVIWDNEGWCVRIASDGANVRNNTCWQNGQREDAGADAEAGELSVQGDAARIHNNVLVAAEGRLALQILDREPDPLDVATIEEDANILWAPTHEDVVAWFDERGTVAAYQAANPGGWGTTSLQEDPVLTDTLRRNFRLTAGSPAVDSGFADDAAATDAAGSPRPLDGDGDGNAVVDRGAYELAAPAGDGDADADADADADGDADIGGSGDGGGCGCQTAPIEASALAWLLLPVALAARRRPPRSTSTSR